MSRIFFIICTICAITGVMSNILDLKGRRTEEECGALHYCRLNAHCCNGLFCCDDGWECCWPKNAQPSCCDGNGRIIPARYPVPRPKQDLPIPNII
uniref:Cysteine rich secreted protein n=1 Tax=Riptortus pedestris TaxID=329032 RepID=R4WQH6_RIPPE|nr:cysteine rich secreted protein [Riptortus pedestris]